MSIEATPEQIEHVAQVCHAANQVLRAANGEAPSEPWDQYPENLKASTRKGVQAFCENPFKTSEESHQGWMDYKLAEGWVYGPVQDNEKKIHPCLVPYGQLPEKQQRKDALFMAICAALLMPLHS